MSAPDPPLRRITGFHRDEAGDWVAELECRHHQHVRHDPPWRNRPWVTSAAGRREALGRPLRCPECRPDASSDDDDDDDEGV